MKELATTEIFSVVRFEGDRQGTRQISTIIWEPLLPLDKERVLWRDIGGFTEEELDFIINYDIKYRMGDKLNDAE